MRYFKISRFQLLTYSLPSLVIISSIAIALSPILKQYPELAMAITFDLTLLSPLLFLLLSGKSGSPKIRVVPIFLIGTAVAAYILPSSGQYHLNLIITYIVPVAELLVMVIVASKIYRILKSFKLDRTPSDDVFVIIKKSTTDLLGDNRLSKFLASELGIFYYSLFAWKRRRSNAFGFTNYKENGSIALTGAFLMVVFIETVAFHVLLMRWSEIAAWVLTITSIYTAIILFGHMKALILRPSELTDRELILKNGIIADLKISLDEIDSIETSAKEMSSENLAIGNLGLSKENKNFNVIISFKQPQTIEKLYGFTETCDVLLLSIDGKNEFVEKVNAALLKLEK